MARRNRRRNRMGDAQLQTIIAYMEQHTLFARGQITKLGAQGHLKYRSMWTDLAEHLNRTGPAEKDVTGWQQTWTKLRLNAKLKKAKFLKALNKTGHDASDPDADLSQTDERISQIYGRYGTGLSIGRELGFRIERVNDDSHVSINQLHLLSLRTERLFYEIPFRMANMIMEFNNNCSRINVSRRKALKAMNKPSQQQLNELIEYMERFPGTLNSESPNYNSLWMSLVTQLNSHRGGAIKTLRAWRRTWSDLIGTARQNMRMMLEGVRNIPLSDHHIKVIDIVGFTEEILPPSTTPVPNTRPLMPTSQHMPSPSYYLSSSSQPMPCSSQHMPSTSQAMPSSRQHLPTSSQFMPSTSQYMPNTSYGAASITQDRQSRAVQSEAPAPKRLRSVNALAIPGVARTATVTSAATLTASGSSGSVPTASVISAAEKSSRFLKAFEDKGAEMVLTLASQLIACFEKQNETIKNGLEAISQTLVQNVPKIVAEEFKKILNTNADSITGQPEMEEEVEQTERTDEQEEANVMNPSEEPQICVICQDQIIDPKKLDCDHSFCKICIETWLESVKDCPICREIVQSDDDDLPWSLIAPDSDDN